MRNCNVMQFGTNQMKKYHKNVKINGREISALRVILI